MTQNMAVVVVSFRSSELLSHNLRHLSDTAQIVIVDSFSSTRERSSVRRLCQENGWLLVEPDTNVGFGRGMNAGVRAARSRLGAENFLLLNPDARIAAESVAALTEETLQHPRRISAPRILRPDGSTWFDGMDLYLEDGHMRASRRRDPNLQSRVAPWLTGACLAISAGLWDELSGFDEDYFLYWEDVDLSWRAVQLGAELQVLPEVTALHDEGATQRESDSTASPEKSDLYYYYNTRNRLLFAAKNLDRVDQQRWLKTSWAEAIAILRRGGNRQFLRPRGPLGAAIRGTRDGRREFRDYATRINPTVDGPR